MKSKKYLNTNIFGFFLLFSLCFTFSILNNNKDFNFNIKPPQTLESIEEIHNLKHSTYWTLPNIYITNWTETNTTYDWCNYKNGHYIIENVTITGVSGKNGIYIENTTENFIIRNSQISKGISLVRAANGKFVNNTISFGQAYPTGTVTKIGIYMGHCANFTIEGNIINGTTDWLSGAIVFYICENITIKENEISNNDYTDCISSIGIDIQGGNENLKAVNNTIFYSDYGIRITQSHLCKANYNRIFNSEFGIRAGGNNHTVSNNIIKISEVGGILSEGSNISILNNKLFNNKVGIMGIGDYCIFYNNSIQDFNEYGFFIGDSTYNIISNNSVQNSEKCGIYLTNTNHSIITGNFVTYKISCIKESDCYGNIISFNKCQKIPGSIFGYYTWIMIGILIMATMVLLKTKLKEIR